MKEKKTRNKAAEKQISRIIAYKKTFGSELGKIVLHDLMRTHFVLSSTRGKTDTDSDHNEGERNVVLRILKILQTNPEALRERIKEIENEHS